MIQITPHSDAAVRIPAEFMYWAILEPPKGARGRQRARQLGFLFESSLPVQIEAVQALYVPLGDGRVLACGLEHDRLTASSVGAIQLCPGNIPEFIRSELERAETKVPDPSALNLLTGNHTPEVVARLQRRLMVVFLTFIVLSSALVILGLERRTARDREHAATQQREIEQLYEHAIGPQPAGGQHPSALLLAELRALRSQTSAEAKQEGPSDVSQPLSQILEAWPEEVDCRTELLTVNQGTARMTIRLSESSDAERIEESLGTLPGWAPAQRSLRRTRDAFLLQLPLTRVAEADS